MGAFALLAGVASVFLGAALVEDDFGGVDQGKAFKAAAAVLVVGVCAAAALGGLVVFRSGAGRGGGEGGKTAIVEKLPSSAELVALPPKSHPEDSASV